MTTESLLSSYQVSQVASHVRSLVAPAEIMRSIPGTAFEDIKSAARKELADAEAELKATEEWGEEHHDTGLAHIRNRCERSYRLRTMYLGEAVTPAQALDDRADRTLLCRCLTIATFKLPDLVQKPIQFATEHSRRLESLSPSGHLYPQVKVYLTETVRRYQEALARLPEIYRSIAEAFGAVMPAMQEHLLTTGPDLERYVSLSRQVDELKLKVEFTGSTNGSIGKRLQEQRAQVVALRTESRTKVTQRLSDSRKRLIEGDLGALVEVVATLNDHPDRFAPGAAREIRLAVYRAMKAVDSLPFALLDTDWPTPPSQADQPGWN
jgi:hypothetical protein